MSEAQDKNIINYDGGNVEYSPDVIATIAGIAALKVEGIAGMSGGITDGIVEILGFKNFKKGVKAEISNMEAVIHLTVAVKYDTVIQDVCARAQAEVKDAVETMTGLNVTAVNITVQGISFDDDKEKKQAK